jgi:FkbM family methyltransferase
MKFQKTKHGEMIFPDQDASIGRSLEHYGEAQHYEIDFLLSLIKADEVFLDIGAGIGNVVIPMAKKIGCNGYVLALEAHPFLYYTLCGNIALNHLGNVQAFHRAASHTSETSCYFPEIDPREKADFQDIQLSVILNSKDHYGRKCGHPVAALSIDDLRLAKPTLIKIDVSGMEIDVLKGLKRTIQRANSILYIRAKEPKQNVMEFLESIGYDWEIHAPPIFNKNNFMYKLDNIFEDRSNRTYAFCYPKGERPSVESDHFLASNDPRYSDFEKMREAYGSTAN